MGKQRRSGFGRLVLIVLLAWLAFACEFDAPNEDCAFGGDEDDNGLVDCNDPACADALSCQPVCGNGEREAGEACDDGNGTNGDGCDNNCTATRCGNGVVTRGERCDDGNVVDGDGCDSNCTIEGL